MSLRKKILLGAVIFFAVLAVSFVTVVGPWPTYSSSFENTGYFKKALADIEKNAQACKFTETPGPLKAGWGVADITPETGVPLAGYSARKSKPSTGAHDTLYVKALALSDGQNTAVIIGTDMLLIPPNIADMVREQVAKETPLTPNNLYFGASHTHDGPGGFSPGIVAGISFGKYDPKVPIFLARQFTSAIVSAYKSMEPAKLAHGGVNAQQFVHNRTRNGPVDGQLHYLVVEKENGKRCFLLGYNAHPTILDDDNMQFTAEYPGYLQRAVEKATGQTAMYLGGAVGSMGPHAPDVPGGDAFARCQAMGEGLAQLVIENTQKLDFKDHLLVASLGVPLQLPSYQVRIMSPKWRLSPLLAHFMGLTGKGWMQGVRVGDVMFVGVPGDFSGEISADWKKWAAGKGYDLWTSGFCAEYAGYISPDKYYNEVTDSKGKVEYETGMMSWSGPHQEAYFTALMEHIVQSLGKAPAPQQTAQPTAGPANGTPRS